LIVKWRDLADEGRLYTEIAKLYPRYTAAQIRHYCLGNTGRKLPGPLQRARRFGGSNVWLQGDKSPHAELTKKQALAVLDDWDEEVGRWRRSGVWWARELGVAPSTIHMLRRGETWKFLQHPNQGRKRGEGPRRQRSKAGTRRNGDG
jgi:hypothetical protein